MIRYEGVIDRPLYRQFLAVHTRPMRAFALLWLLAVLYALVTGNQDNVGVIVILIFAIVILALPWWGTWRAFKTNKFLGQRYFGDADGEALTLNSPTGTNRIPWTLFYRRRVTNNIALVYPVGQMAYVFAPSFFGSAEEWDAFTRLVRENVPAKRGAALRPAIIIAVVVAVFLVWSLIQSGK